VRVTDSEALVSFLISVLAICAVIAIALALDSLDHDDDD